MLRGMSEWCQRVIAIREAVGVKDAQPPRGGVAAGGAGDTLEQLVARRRIALARNGLRLPL